MLTDEIKIIMDHSKETYNVPFADIAISKNNEIVCRYKNGTINGNELYFLYSATKPITCVAALQLYEKGLIKLDDCVCKYIPEYKNMNVKKSDGTIEKAKTEITIKDLFAMTSGINYNLTSESIIQIKDNNPNASTLDIVRAIAKEPLDFHPGTYWQYGLNHDVLAAIIEIVSRMSFGEYLTKNIFDVCGMTNTHLHYNKDMYICDQFRYDSEKKAVVPMEKENSFIFTPNYESGGAGIISTVDDYMKFAQTLINTDKLLKVDTLKLMISPQIDGDAYQYFKSRNKGYSYGLGVRVNIDSDSSSKGEFGWDGAAGAYVLLDLEHKIAVFYASHVRDYGFYQYDVLHVKIRDTVYKYLK